VRPPINALREIEKARHSPSPRGMRRAGTSCRGTRAEMIRRAQAHEVERKQDRDTPNRLHVELP